MKKIYLSLLFTIIPIACMAATLTVQTYNGNSVELPEISPNAGSGTQIELFVTANSTMPWNINMKCDSFTTIGSTIPITATYAIFKNGCDDFEILPLPTSLTTIYTSLQSEYKTDGTTITLSIDLNPIKETKIGLYKSNLHLEISQ